MFCPVRELAPLTPSLEKGDVCSKEGLTEDTGETSCNTNASLSASKFPLGVMDVILTLPDRDTGLLCDWG